MAEQPPLMPIRRPRGPSPQQVRRRRIAALLAIVLAVGLGIAAVIVALPHVHTTKALPPPPPAPKPFRVIFPEGFTRAQMIERVGVVAKIAARKKHHAVALNSRTYALATRGAKIPCFTPPQRRNLEGFLFPATYDFLATTTSRELAADQLETFCKNWNQVNLAYAKSKNLTPYDVLIIASMVEKETLPPDERPKVAAVIYNRLHEHMPLGIDATLRYGMHIRPRSTTSTSCASPTRCITSSRRATRRSRSTSARTATAVDPAGRSARAPGRGVAVATHAERGVRRPWVRLALRRVRRARRRRSGARVARARLCRRQRDRPAQAGGRRGLRRGRRSRRQHPRLRRRPRRGSQHRPCDPRRHRCPARVCDRRRWCGSRTRRGAAGRDPVVLPPRSVAAGCDGLRPDRERNTGARRVARRPAGRADGGRPGLRRRGDRPRGGCARGRLHRDRRARGTRSAGRCVVRTLDGARGADRRDARGGQALDHASAPPASAATPPQAQSRSPNVSRPLCRGAALTTATGR